jgi:uncharacterized heparinase superfamily protein
MLEYTRTRVRRVLQKPPQIIVRRLMTELNVQTDRFRAPMRQRALDTRALCALTGAGGLDELWQSLANRIHAVPVRAVAAAQYARVCPGDADRILAAADRALAHEIDLLGTGPVKLGRAINWHTDFKTGKTWPLGYMRDIDYVALGCPSDVKVPWEISRMQWLIPAGQAFLLTGDERYAEAVRDVIQSWIEANPYAQGVNWACTMEVAMRIFSWTWFFHVFAKSRAWSAAPFRSAFLRSLFLHGEFTERYLERSDINGNHFTADAAALVCAGLFFGRGASAERWAEQGWKMLCAELPRQVTPDGVDFEASVAYHRLVAELFFFAARFREAYGLPVPDAYKERVVAMARFTQAYARPDGTTPLVGDADDARVLPFGGQEIGDHRYFAGIVGAHWDVEDLMSHFSGPLPEVFWMLGSRAAAKLAFATTAARPLSSAAFRDGGFYVMRNATDHVFIDCGPVGQAGRGGHGHNDCLSFEAALDGVRLISDCGAFLYTANPHERNRFRSTPLHNTPQIDEEEVNRFIRWDYLWTLHDDAKPEVRTWEPGAERDLFVGTHTGYQRLAEPVRPIRAIALDHARHVLSIADEICGKGTHTVTIPLQLAPGVAVHEESDTVLVLRAEGREFVLEWSGDASWRCEIGAGRVSPSYGVALPAARIVWRREGSLPTRFSVTLAPR